MRRSQSSTLRITTTTSGGGRASSEGGRLGRYAARYLSTVQGVRTAGSLIDVGTSRSPFPNLAAKAGYQVTVADWVRPATLDAGIGFVSASLDDEKMAATIARTFDVVTAFAVIEHCRFPLHAAKNLAGICAPGGLVILTTPLAGTYFERQAAGFSGWYYPPEHLHIFSRLGMTRLFRSVGCDLVHFERFELNSLRKLRAFRDLRRRRDRGATGARRPQAGMEQSARAPHHGRPGSRTLHFLPHCVATGRAAHKRAGPS